MSNYFGLKLICKSCQSSYDWIQTISYCKKCGIDKSYLEFCFDLKKQKKGFFLNYIKKYQISNILKKYSSLLPIKGHDFILTAPEIVITPYFRSHQISQYTGLSNIWIKDETRNTTGSIKDRASYLGTFLAKHVHGAEKIATASTGNQAISMAAYAAAVGLDSVVFVSENISVTKEKILERYGSKIIKVRGSYDDAYEKCLKTTEEHGWINKSAGLSPVCFEGIKTAAYEICEQSQWNPPDVIIVPVGDGTVLTSLAKGFIEYFELTLTHKIPRMIGIQSAQCNPAVQAYHLSSAKNIYKPYLISNCTYQSNAESICVRKPRDLSKLLYAVKATQGTLIDVEESSIQESQLFFSQEMGICLELASSTVLAGLIKAKKMDLFKSSDSIALVLTGSGFKEGLRF